MNVSHPLHPNQINLLRKWGVFDGSANPHRLIFNILGTIPPGNWQDCKEWNKTFSFLILFDEEVISCSWYLVQISNTNENRKVL